MLSNNTQEIPLVKKFPKLKALPHVNIIKSPTPVEKMVKTNELLGGMNIWIKRDDLTNVKYGGNKPRKYEFVIPYVQKRKKKHVLTVGGLGTNHGLATTIFARDFGIRTSLYLYNQPLTQHVRENLLCHYFYGAELNYTKDIKGTVYHLTKDLIRDWSSYYLCAGASNSVGTIGFINAGLELADQIIKGDIPEPDKLFVAVGSMGMVIGLYIGLELAGLKTKIMGICVVDEKFNSVKKLNNLSRKTLKRLRKIDKSIPEVTNKLLERLTINRSFFGGGYGRITYEGLEAIEIAKNDGIELDPVYTGKTFSALVDYCRNNPNAKNETILYWHSKNSVDLSSIYNSIDYKDLPKKFHQFFDGTVEIDDKAVYCVKK
ncbi:MAG: 1-aminocyclopropane-1-carboxylate deaminase/D-cysteine desulfhydrase [Promethearchaeota archaeon]